MPITLTSIGSTLDVSIIDDNFKSLQDLFRSGLQAADIVSGIDKYRIQFFQNGKIVRSIGGSFPFRPQKPAGSAPAVNFNDIFDITYRRGGENCGDITVTEARRYSGPRGAYAMELLGRPGPSFILSYTEDGKDDPPAGTVGWPPSWWPVNRYPSNLCYSRWLTVPNACLRVFVPYPCIAKVKASALGSTSLWTALNRQDQDSESIWIATTNENWHCIRTGLIVDTNPVLYPDEFANDNQWIVDPITGLQSDYRTWKVITDQTVSSNQRQKFALNGEVALKGGRWYNFKYAFRDAQTHGWLDWTASPPTFREGVWEDSVSGAAPNRPTSTNYPLASALYHPFYPPWINLWEHSGIQVEFKYGRSAALVDDEGSTEWDDKPAYPWE